MPISLITLTTDFGSGSPYAAAMKGVLLSNCPNVPIIDLSHDLPPCDLSATAYFLWCSLPYFPSESLHIVVVDPGVGTTRRVILVEWDQARILAPDNGCWDSMQSVWGKPTRVFCVENLGCGVSQISPTFHGRDIFAPLAGSIAAGLEPSALGRVIHDWVGGTWSLQHIKVEELCGVILHVDRFGNLITNLRCDDLTQGLEEWCCEIGEEIITSAAITYGNMVPGVPTMLRSSNDLLEIAIRGENAATHLKASSGTLVRLKKKQSPVCNPWNH